MKIQKIINLIKKTSDNSIKISNRQIQQSINITNNLSNKLLVQLINYSPSKLLCQLLIIFKKDFIIALMLYLINVSIIISLPFFNKILNQSIKNNQGYIIIVGQIFGYKILSILSILSSNLSYQILGIKFYLWYQNNMIKNIITKFKNGQKINFIDDDAQKIINVPYAIINIIFLTIQIIILSTILVILVPKLIIEIICIVVVFLCICIILSYCSYRINYQLMKYKDNRLNKNLLNNTQLISNARIDQLKQIKILLILNMIVKFFAHFGYGFLYFYVFWQGGQMSFSQKSSILILINLLRYPMERITFVWCIMMEIYNSLLRINKGTTKKIQRQIDLNSKLNSYPYLKYGKQVGQIKLLQLYQKIQNGISIWYLILILISILIMLTINIFSLFISQKIVQSEYTSITFLILPSQLLSILLIFLSNIYLSIKISKYISQKLFKNSSSFQVTNRLSGDIRSLDIRVCLNFSDFTIVSLSILASLIYTTISLNALPIALIFAGFLFLVILISFKINRYSMWARRQIMRKQCKTKTLLIKKLWENKKQKSLNILKRIYNCKMLGLLIQNFSIIVLLIFSVLIVTIGTIICLYLSLPTQTTILMLFSLMQLDNQLLLLSISSIRLQLALISMQRCLNLIKNKEQIQQHINDIL